MNCCKKEKTMAGSLSALIPAAGFSSRMHQYKPLLMLGDKPMIEVVIKLFQRVGITDIIVVTGHNHSLLEPLIKKAGARPVYNQSFETGMLGSIQKGVGHVRQESRGFFLLPVDIPAIRTGTIQTMVSAFERTPEHIIIPEFDHTPGHPPLIPARLISEIIDLGEESTLRQLLFSQKEQQIRLPIHDRGILLDADTKEVYELLSKRCQHINIPDKKECWSIIHSFLDGETIVQFHLGLVANTALKLYRAVENGQNQKGKKTSGIVLNKKLIRAAALLHDIKRKEKNHSQAGSHLLESLGFPQVAGIVAEHMCIEPGDLISEKEIVYFADKLCNGIRLEVDYGQRFADKIKQFPRAKARIYRRYKASQQIQTRIETVAGQSIQSILQ